MLADLDSLERRLLAAQKKARGGDKECIAQVALMEPIVAALREGPAGADGDPPGQEDAARRLQLLTTKPVLYVCNVEEASAATGNAQSARVAELAAREGARHVVISAAIEAEVSAVGRRKIARNSWKGWGCTTAGWIGSSAPATPCSACSPTSRWGRRRRAPGRSSPAPRRRRRRR